MKKTVLISFLFTCCAGSLAAQKISVKPGFSPGQTILVTMHVKNVVSQDALGNAIDMDSEATAFHSYKVTNATADNTTLRHEVNRISFKIDGMGLKRSFDSDNPKDLEGQFGKPVKDILSKRYDMIIDPFGTTLLVKPEKIELEKSDDRVAIVLNFLKDVTQVVFPPKKNTASFFKVLPDTAVGIGDSWTDSLEDANGKTSTTYELSSVSDSTITVDIKGRSSSVTKAEMMGMPTTTNMKSVYNGKIILDRTSGLIREKVVNVESHGNTEAMGGTMPITSRTTIKITLSPGP